MFEFDINWDEHSGACEDVDVFGFIGPWYFSIQYIVPEKWCGEKGFTLTVDFVLLSLSLTCDRGLGEAPRFCAPVSKPPCDDNIV